MQLQQQQHPTSEDFATFELIVSMIFALVASVANEQQTNKQTQATNNNNNNNHDSNHNRVCYFEWMLFFCGGATTSTFTFIFTFTTKTAWFNNNEWHNNKMNNTIRMRIQMQLALRRQLQRNWRTGCNRTNERTRFKCYINWAYKLSWIMLFVFELSSYIMIIFVCQLELSWRWEEYSIEIREWNCQPS